MSEETEELAELADFLAIRERFRVLRTLQQCLRSSELRHRSLQAMEATRIDLEHARLARWPSGLFSDFDFVYDGFQGVTVLGGTSGAGKSQMALACALENADSDGGCCVVYFDAENVAGEIKPRVMRWYGGEAPFHQRFSLISQHRFRWVPVRMGHTWSQMFHCVADWLDSSHERALVVLDSLQKIAKRIAPSANMLNTTQQMLNAMEELVQQSEGRIGFLVLSELNKDDQIKGGSGLYDSTMALKITPEEDYLVRIEVLKNRNGRRGTDLGLYELDWSICRLRKYST